jgi:hypothetical protein
MSEAIKKKEVCHQLIIKNKKIVDFYKRYPDIDIEKVNLLYIDLFDNFMSSTLDNPSIISQIVNKLESQTKDINNIFSLINNNNDNQKNELSTIKSLYNLNSDNIKSEFDHIKSLIAAVNTTVSNNIYETKDEYLKELKEILTHKSQESSLQLSTSIEKQNIILIDKMLNTINEIIPKSNSKTYEDIIKYFKNDMEDTLNKLKDPQTDISLEKISNIIDVKYNNIILNLQDHILKCISTSETRLTTNIEQIKELSTKTSITQNKMADEFITYINKYKVSSSKGIQGENKLYKIINDEYSNAELENTSGKSGMGDMILKRQDKPSIIIETKEYTTNVKKDEIDKFLRDVNKNNLCGIFLSQRSGIVGKDNYQIEINNNNILVYVHYVEYDITKIKIAVNIIDFLLEKLKDINKNDITITNQILKDINYEFNKFITQKNIIITELKDYHKKLLEQLIQLSLPNLELLLSKHFSDTRQPILICQYCDNYKTSTAKSLARHQQSCKKNIK